MITFIDGPAKDISLTLSRTPIMLRVVHSILQAEWDALDQLDDKPRRDETIYLYQLVGKPAGFAFIDYRDKQGRRRGCRTAIAKYRMHPVQPTDAELRDGWSDWCQANAAAIIAERGTETGGTT